MHGRLRNLSTFQELTSEELQLLASLCEKRIKELRRIEHNQKGATQGMIEKAVTVTNLRMKLTGF